MKRTLLLGSAWTASAAAAVGLGFLAISLVDASASPGGQTLAASVTTESSGGSPSSSSPTDSPVATAGQQVTEGGTVYGSCDGGVPVLASAPAAGWWLDDSSSVGQVEFQNDTLKIEVHVTCVGGVAQFSVEGPRGDDSHGNDATTSAPAATSHSSGDDSDGRVGGGHGSDDAVAPAPVGTATPSVDDSDGRVSGGHGSDDAATSAPAATTHSSGDDSGNGSGSGSGSGSGDDSGSGSADDSSGRVGGGHGSDD
jgi:hypothetical protein